MAALRGKTAIVTGASSGVGKATVKALVSEGARVIGVARGEAGLAALRTEMPQGLDTVRADSSEPGLAERLLRETRPDLIVVVGGVRPKMAPIDEQSWEEFSETWNSDMKTAFHFCKGAVALPLRPGSTVVLVSSGAASNGSHLSGGYAGAKRMQWWLAGYAKAAWDPVLGRRAEAAHRGDPDCRECIRGVWRLARNDGRGVHEAIRRTARRR